MADHVYPMITEALARGLISGGLEQTPVVLVLVDASYTYDAAHEFLASVASGSRVATSMALRAKTFAAGVFVARKAVLMAVTGATVTQAVACTSLGNAVVNRLIACWQLPVAFVPSGSDVSVEWDADGVLSLSGAPV